MAQALISAYQRTLKALNRAPEGWFLAGVACVAFTIEAVLALASMPLHDYLVLQGALFGVVVPIMVVLNAIGALLIRWAWPDHGGYRANRRVNPRTVRPPPGGSAVQPPS